jgi:putative resolvase
MLYNISKFSKMTGLHQNTLRNWDASGKLKPIVLASGHRRYDDSHLNIIKNIHQPKKILKNIIYARVDTKQKKEELQNQIKQCKEFCIAKGIIIDKVIQDFGSSLDFAREGLNLLINMIENEEVYKIIILYRDILTKYSFGLLETICKIHNTEIIIIDKTIKED